MQPIVTPAEMAEIDAAAQRLRAEIEALSTPAEPLELRVVDVLPGEAGQNTGTRLLSALDEAAAQAAPGQIAGAVLVTDGQIHDPGRLTGFPAPVHGLIAGRRDGFDLALEAVSAPSFGIVGESVVFSLVAHGGHFIGISAAFWILFVYVLQISVVRNRLRQAGRWVSRLLGTVLIALGIRLWFSEAPG